MSLRLEPSQEDIKGIQLSTVSDEALLAWGEEKGGRRGKLYLIEAAKSLTAKLYAAKITTTRMLILMRAGKYSREESKALLKSWPSSALGSSILKDGGVGSLATDSSQSDICCQGIRKLPCSMSLFRRQQVHMDIQEDHVISAVSDLFSLFILSLDICFC